MNKKIAWFVGIMGLVCLTGLSAGVDTQPLEENDSKMSTKTVSPASIKVGSEIQCVMVRERHMKMSDEHYKYIVTIRGVVVKKALPDIHLRVVSVNTKNLKREDGEWIQDRSVVKRPPYTTGETYSFREQEDVSNTAVYSGVYRIFFSADMDVGNR